LGKDSIGIFGKEEREGVSFDEIGTGKDGME
jgi:hypothetical protein